MGYWELLCSCWQSADCTISSDAMELATMSGLGDELWAVYGTRIVRKFAVVGSRLRNEVLFREWSEAQNVYLKRRTGAVRTNTSRSADAVRTQSARSTDTHTHTHTDTDTVVQIQLQLPSSAPVGARVDTPIVKVKRKRVPKEPRVRAIRKVAVIDPRHVVFRDSFRAYFMHKNPLLTQEPWDGQEAAHLAKFLRKNPEFGPDAWKTVLRHRARSPVAHSESLSAWIGRALGWVAGPTDAFGKTGGINGKPARIDEIERSTRHASELLRMVDVANWSGGSVEAGSGAGRVCAELDGASLGDYLGGDWTGQV